MRCPNCNFENHESTLRCNCGYDFVMQKWIDPYTNRRKASTGQLVLGWVLATLGGLLGIFISYSIAFSKDKYGYCYDSESRKIGIAMFIFSIFMFAVGVAIRVGVSIYY
jgi:hypothetical protein